MLILRDRSDGVTGERAFTLIELVVVLVLAAILFAFVTQLLVRGFAGGGKSQAERRASESVDRTIAVFGDDVRRMTAPDRAPSSVSDPLVLQDALLRRGGAVSGTATTLDVRDVVEATATSFAFRADVLPNSTAGVDECVRYYATGTPPRLHREVWDSAQIAPATGCAGTLLRSETLIERVR